MDDILREVFEKYGEWIEEASPDEDLLVIQILCQMVQKERKENEWLIKKMECLKKE